jgi:hypothetical protein
MVVLDADTEPPHFGPDDVTTMPGGASAQPRGGGGGTERFEQTVNQPRSQWGPGALVERPFSIDEANRQFKEAKRATGLAPS